MGTNELNCLLNLMFYHKFFFQGGIVRGKFSGFGVLLYIVDGYQVT